MSLKEEQQFFSKLGQRIAKIRTGAGMSQERLSEKTGLDRVAIGYIEQGRRKPTVRSVYLISKALNVSLQELFKYL